MLVEIGHFALVLALLVAAMQGVVPLIGAQAKSRALMDLARPAALLQFGLVALSCAIFIHAHIVSDFSVLNVFENSSLEKPMLYKVTGAWGSHEGSMMLWVFMLALFGGLVALFSRSLPASLRARTLAIQGLLGFGTLLFILGTSDPFTRLRKPVAGVANGNVEIDRSLSGARVQDKILGRGAGILPNVAYQSNRGTGGGGGESIGPGCGSSAPGPRFRYRCPWHA